MLLAEFRLPTLLVTHAFEDAAALARRVGVIDRGRLIQLAPPAELLRHPADAMVAALTGANVIDGDRAPGGGRRRRSCLPAAASFGPPRALEGPVQIAIHPWELELADPAASDLTDTVVSVSPTQGGIARPLTRFTVQSGPDETGRPAPAEGQLVGLERRPVEGAGFRRPTVGGEPGLNVAGGNDAGNDAEESPQRALGKMPL